MEFQKTGGQSAHRWRKKLAATATHKVPRQDYAQTFKFPVDLGSDGLPAGVVDDTETLYKIVEGYGKGSLTGLLCAVHLSGFRLFSKFDDAADFAKKNNRHQPSKKINIAFDQTMQFIDMQEVDSSCWIHLCVSLLANHEKNQQIKDIKSRITSFQGNGLAWLFGAGWQWLQKTSESELAKVMEISTSGSEFRRIKQLKFFADAIPSPTLWDEHYSRYRNRIQGRTDSWVSNYWNRLTTLRKFCENQSDIVIPDQLKNEENRDIFSGNTLKPNQMQQINEELNKEIKASSKTISRLMGQWDSSEDSNKIANSIEDFSTLSAQISSLIGEVAVANNRIDQENEEREKKSQLKNIRWQNNRPKEPERLNRWGREPETPSQYRVRLSTQFNEIIQLRSEHYDDLKKSFCYSSPIEDLTSIEHDKLAKKNADQTLAEENARRYVLHSLAILVRKGSLSAERPLSCLQKRIVAALPPKDDKERKNKNGNRFFYNWLGKFYVSPFSSRQHKPFFLSDEGYKEDWVAVAEEHLVELKKQYFNTGDVDIEIMRQILELENFCFSMRLRCLPNELPSKFAEPLLEASDKEWLHLNPLWRLQIKNNEKIEKAFFLKLFNQYQSAINGCCSQLARKSVITRVLFSRDNTAELIYVPKNNSWQPPEAYLQNGKSPIARALQSDWVVWSDESRSTVDTVKTFAKIWDKSSKIKVKSLPDMVAAYLIQAPHDWCLSTAFDGVGDVEEHPSFKIKMDEGKITNAGKVQKNLLRLRGPSSWRSRLDLLIRAEDSNQVFKAGDPNLILDTRYRQQLKISSNKCELNLELEKTTLEVAIPIFHKRSVSKDLPLIWNRLVAVDQGERGIGYAVFDLEQWLQTGKATPVTDENNEPVVGTLPIKSIRTLIGAVSRHRSRNQPAQKMTQKYSNLLEKRRQNVVGDVCHAIENLMRKYRAFPVLESSVSNFEMGSKQLSMVYKSVTSMFVYGENDARNQNRYHHWHMGKSWHHPWLKRGDAANKKTDDQVLKLFPGNTVFPAGTSQTCHQCQINVIKIIEDLKKAGKMPKLTVLKDKTVKLPEADIIVSLTPPKNWPAKKQKGSRYPFPSVEPGTIRVDDLLKKIRKFMRHRHPDPRSRDTKQSRFNCLNKACRWSGHADSNAAVNIGVKFLKEKIDMAASKAAKQQAAT